VFGLVAEIDAKIGGRSERDQFTLTPQLVLRSFTGDYALSGTDFGLAADYRRNSELAQWALGIAFFSDDASTSGFDSVGYVERAVPRESTTLSASYAYTMAPRTTFYAHAEPQRVRFDAGPQSGFVDYDYVPALLFLQREVTPRMRLRTLARVALLHAPETGLRSDELGAGLGLDYQLSERWSASLDLGPTWLSTDDGPFQSGLSYKAGIDRRWTRTRLQFNAQRSSSPTAGRGIFETRDDLDFGLRHELGDRWSVDGGVAVARYQRDDGAAGAAEDRTYGRTHAAVQWRASENMSLQLSMVYERQDADVIGDGTRVSLGASWNGRVKAMSR
jgi:hypothetical protein